MVVIILDTVEAIRGIYLLVTLTQWMKPLTATLFILSGRPQTEKDKEDWIAEELQDPHRPLPVTELRGWRRDIVAALVRYHNSKSEPQLEHASYAALDGERRRQARLLTSLLRIAEKLESEHAQRISGVDVQISGRKAIFVIRAMDGTRLDLLGLERKSDLFEKEFQLKPEFRRAQGKEKVA